MGNPNNFAFTGKALLHLVFLLLMIYGEIIPSSGVPCTTLDIHLDSGIQGRNGLIDPSSRWKTFRVQISDAFSGKERAQIERVITMFRDILPCVTFRILPSDSKLYGDYVHVTNRNEGCYSYLGRVGGKQVLNLDNGCVYDDVIIHELLHAMGLHHEQNRSDRDDYVDIFWGNIRPGYASQFEKLAAGEFSDFGVPYNYNSIMHYYSEEFSSNGKSTILKKDGSKIGENSKIQESDILKLRRLYDCSNEVA